MTMKNRDNELIRSYSHLGIVFVDEVGLYKWITPITEIPVKLYLYRFKGTA